MQTFLAASWTTRAQPLVVASVGVGETFALHVTVRATSDSSSVEHRVALADTDLTPVDLAS